MTPLLQLLDATLADPLHHARRLAQSGEHMVGMASADLPAELVLAARALPVSLPALADTATPLADRYLESSFSPAAKSIVDQWLAGRFDFMKSVIFPRANDSLQRTYYYLCELRRRGLAAGPTPLLYDIAKIPRSTSAKHSIESTRRLAHDLGSEGAALGIAIQQRNRRRELLREFRALRLNTAASISGQWAERIGRLADACEAAEFDQALKRWMQTPIGDWRGPRLLLAGSAPPDDRLHCAVETGGGRVVDEFGDHALDRLGDDIAIDDPLNAIAAHYAELPTGSRSFRNWPQSLCARARSSQVQGVILWAIEEDESLVWSVPGIRGALAAAGIPLLELTRRRWDAKDDTAALVRSFTAQLKTPP
jgi:benzoyl-CoA reductase/2-hydroxyglutaryl-CoA dehydratase subunit BcrC/BadD/HgdB